MREALLRAHLIDSNQVEAQEEELKFDRDMTLGELVKRHPLLDWHFGELPKTADVFLVKSHRKILSREPKKWERMITGYGTDLVGDILIVRADPESGRVVEFCPTPKDNKSRVENLGESLGPKSVVVVVRQLPDDIIIWALVPKGTI